jgi:hypothetical protein
MPAATCETYDGTSDIIRLHVESAHQLHPIGSRILFEVSCYITIREIRADEAGHGTKIKADAVEGRDVGVVQLIPDFSFSQQFLGIMK